jgi:hypothetical protein
VNQFDCDRQRWPTAVYDYGKGLVSVSYITVS